MSRKPYEFLEHTADVAVLVRGVGLKQLFAHAARALFDVMAVRRGRSIRTRPTTLNVRATGGTREDTFINWLNELLSLSAVNSLIFSEFRILSVDDKKIAATVVGRPSSAYFMKKEVKAATYHDLALTRIPRGWEARVIFDV